jgi:prepilin-type N-terminal cleavage/methylation domain-containing protein/prepilin-type processing-associated H-X9-DG protein
MRSQVKHGFTLIELLVVIAIIAILASILFPVFAKAREKARQTTCLSQIRQIAIAAQMYDQDNNARYPGWSGWDSLLGTYLGNNAQMFTCPSDSSTVGAVNSYGYNGMLVRADGSGVNEAVILAPTEVGIACDASPSMTYGSGGLIGGGGLQASTLTQLPAPRHSNGTVVGYCDGHASYCPNGYNAQDVSNNVTRAFYLVDALGLINSPGGGLSAISYATGQTYNTNTVTIGGDMPTMPILTAAAEAWKVAISSTTGYYTRGFLGNGSTTGRQADYVWGFADGGYSGATGQVSLGYDQLVFIVSKNTKIAASNFNATTSSGVYAGTTAQIGALLNYYDSTLGSYTGYSANAVQAYTYNTNAGNRTFLTGATINVPVGNQAIVASDDMDMVNKVASDPYGIGYCSSAMADPNKVQILGIVTNGTANFYPQTNPKYRWIMPTLKASLSLPSSFTRQLYCVTNGNALSTTSGTMGYNLGTILSVMETGPLFQASYLYQ